MQRGRGRLAHGVRPAADPDRRGPDRAGLGRTGGPSRPDRPGRAGRAAARTGTD